MITKSREIKEQYPIHVVQGVRSRKNCDVLVLRAWELWFKSRNIATERRDGKYGIDLFREITLSERAEIDCGEWGIRDNSFCYLGGK
uniref:Uncharacterized protein n=1 Tax=viral metagenome TaxID=1070528 RepID=A0A6M3J9B9_9ZZZZ